MKHATQSCSTRCTSPVLRLRADKKTGSQTQLRGFSMELSREFRAEQREVSAQTKKLPIIFNVSVGSSFIHRNK